MLVDEWRHCFANKSEHEKPALDCLNDDDNAERIILYELLYANLGMYIRCPKPNVNMVTLFPNLAFSSRNVCMMLSLLSDGSPSVRNRINFSTK